MFKDEFTAVCNGAKGKLNLLNNNPVGYFIASMVAGVFIAFGGFVMLSVGGHVGTTGGGKVVMAVSFAAALSLVVMDGAGLFSGNNFVMASAAYAGEVKWADVVKLWVVCYIGNLVGSLLAAVMFHFTGLATGAVGEVIATVAAAKMGGTALALFMKGIFCNVLVCLAVWCCTKMKTESGKLVMIFWCIFVFVFCGFEHSVANMTIMASGLLDPNGVAGLSIGGYVYNLVIVTIGNMIGGAILVAGPYYLIQKSK